MRPLERSLERLHRATEVALLLLRGQKLSVAYMRHTGTIGGVREVGNYPGLLTTVVGACRRDGSPDDLPAVTEIRRHRFVAETRAYEPVPLAAAEVIFQALPSGDLRLPDGQVVPAEEAVTYVDALCAQVDAWGDMLLGPEEGPTTGTMYRAVGGYMVASGKFLAPGEDAAGCFVTPQLEKAKALSDWDDAICSEQMGSSGNVTILEVHVSESRRPRLSEKINHVDHTDDGERIVTAGVVTGIVSAGASAVLCK